VDVAYLLLRSNAGLYHPPRHGSGVSDIGFFPVPRGADPGAELTSLIQQPGTAFRDGHEIGTHYNGHFCGRSDRAVGAWNADDWRSELDQFHSLLGDVGSNNGLGRVDPPVGRGQISGGRTPCLEGNTSSGPNTGRCPGPIPASAGCRSVATWSRGTGRRPLLGRC
jgi:hypothetical protein